MIGSATLTGRADDLIDALLHVTRGEVLAPPSQRNRNGRGGEYDGYVQGLSRRDVKRLVAAGLISSHGMPADRLAAWADSNLSADAFVAWYCAQGLAGLDQRAELRNGDSWVNLKPPEPAALPEKLVDYLNRLLCDRKRQYAAEVTLAIVEGAPIPASSERWADQVVAKVQRYWQRGG